MKKTLLLLLCLLVSCTQGQKRDGGWAKNRRNQDTNSEQPRDEQPGTTERQPREASLPAPPPPGPLGTPGATVNGKPALVAYALPEDPLAVFAQVNVGDDFFIDFGAEAELIPPGLIYGINDLMNATPGVWKAWARAVTPTGGMLRLWGKYSKEKFGEDHIQTALRAQQAGLDVMFTAVDTENESRAFEGDPLSREPEPEDWSRDVIRDVKRMRDRGINVTHIEIWNEPDLGNPWPGTPASFGVFFARAGNLLRAEFGNAVSIGGPGLATSLGESMEWPREMFQASAREGFQPDFYSWHQYGSNPTENEMLQTPQVMLNEAHEAGIALNQLILSEWNIGLPHPVLKDLDNERAANYYLAMVISLSHTPVNHASFFFLQDAPWDTNKELSGESVGVFSLAGAPKALLSGMRMMAKAGDLPAVPVERLGAPSNISLFASREGDKGYLIAVNTLGEGVVKHANRVLSRDQVDSTSLRRNKQKVQAFIQGRAQRSSLNGLGIPESTLDSLDGAKAVIEALNEEVRAGKRTITIQLASAPKRIRSLKVIDNKHGNPMQDKAFQQAYLPYSKGLTRAAVDETLAQLKEEGVSQKDCDSLLESMSSRTQAKDVDRATQQRARTLFEEHQTRLASEIPLTLSQEDSTFPCEVRTDTMCTLKGDTIEIRLPLETSVLIELDW